MNYISTLYYISTLQFPFELIPTGLATDYRLLTT
jgi:hypothetical protein